MIVLGLILFLLGLFLHVGILETIGIVLLVIGAVLWILGAVGPPLAGRRIYWYPTPHTQLRGPAVLRGPSARPDHDASHCGHKMVCCRRVPGSARIYKSRPPCDFRDAGETPRRPARPSMSHSDGKGPGAVP